MRLHRLIRARNLTLPALIEELAALRGDKAIGYHEGFTGLDGLPRRVWRMIDLHREVDALSRFLVEEAGLRRGDRLAICKTNDTRCFHWFLAAIRAGGIAVPLNPLLSLAELRSIIVHCGANVLVTDRAVFQATIDDPRTLPVGCWIQDDTGGETMAGFLRPTSGYLEAPPLAQPALGPDDPVAVFHTSGTQGTPKGAMLSSRSLLGGRAMGALVAPFVGASDLALFTLPWAHIMAVSTALHGLIAGLPACFLDSFDAARAIEIIERRRVTVFIGVPAMFIRLLNADPRPDQLASVRLWISASDHLPIAQRRRLLGYGALCRCFGRRLLKPLFLNAYGMVELGGIALLGVGGGLFPARGDLCLPLPPFRVRIVGENGRRARRGEVGECQVRGPGVTSGYWDDAGSTADLFTPDGWLRTGDLALRSRLGFVRLVGRDKEIIKCGGYTVHARDVEETVAAHPAVARAVVIGIPHPEKGEVPVGVVELRDPAGADERALIEWCRSRLAAYKAPRRIHIVESGGLPQGVTQKILKRRLLERFGGEPAANP